MKYVNITTGRFLSRPNRFAAEVETDGVIHTVHVKNTGRCRELLVPGCKVFLAEAANPQRRTRCDLVAVIKEREEESPILINMDSQIPNKAAEEWVRGKIFPESALVRREVKHGDSRFDIYAEWEDTRAFLEVKGVTLEKHGVAMFPDAPTARGVKHLRELSQCAREGFAAYVMFGIQMKGARVFRPNEETDPVFARALREARDAGVHILAYDCKVTPDSMEIDAPVKIEL